MCNKRKPWIMILILTVLMIMLMLETQTILKGTQDGIHIAVNNIIPSLFPFIFISSLLNKRLLGMHISFLRPVCQLTGIPQGAESLLLLGLIGGYPLGAQLISDSYRNGQLDKHCAQRMLGFCNNAGPAFIIGMLAPLFSAPITVYILWFIHILSALTTGIILPHKNRSSVKIRRGEYITLATALNGSLKILAGICGWVILFRGLISVFELWFMPLLPKSCSVFLAGMLELSNGCISLLGIPDERIRFLLSSCMLSAGGLCIVMQTKSIVGDLGLGMYLPGKTLQAAISTVFSIMASICLYGWDVQYTYFYMFSFLACGILITITCIYFSFMQKKRWNSAKQWCIL